MFTRLIKAELVTHQRLFHGRHGVFYLTRLGADYTDLPSIKNVPKDNYIHQLMIIETYLKLREQYSDTNWISERRIVHEKFMDGVDKKNHHLPDGILILPDFRQIAIEVELTMKSKQRLENIIWGYMLCSDINEVCITVHMQWLKKSLK